MGGMAQNNLAVASASMALVLFALETPPARRMDKLCAKQLSTGRQYILGMLPRLSSDKYTISAHQPHPDDNGDVLWQIVRFAQHQMWATPTRVAPPPSNPNQQWL